MALMFSEGFEKFPTPKQQLEAIVGLMCTKYPGSAYSVTPDVEMMVYNIHIALPEGFSVGASIAHDWNFSGEMNGFGKIVVAELEQKIEQMKASQLKSNVHESYTIKTNYPSVETTVAGEGGIYNLQNLNQTTAGFWKSSSLGPFMQAEPEAVTQTTLYRKWLQTLDSLAVTDVLAELHANTPNTVQWPKAELGNEAEITAKLKELMTAGKAKAWKDLQNAALGPKALDKPTATISETAEKYIKYSDLATKLKK